MAGGIRGARIKNRLPEFLSTVDRQAAKVLLQAGVRVASEAAGMTPRETSNLINSQFTDVQKVGTRWRCRIGYTAEYAEAVHEAPGTLLGTNTPRPKRGGTVSKGVVWGPSGEPEFLRKAGELVAGEVAAIIRRGLNAKAGGLPGKNRSQRKAVQRGVRKGLGFGKP
jgi:hypothetical protein